MYLSDFFYDLPEELIAKYPAPSRTQSRLLCLDEEISHHYFYEILNFITPKDLIVLNNTKVLPARLYGEKDSGGKIEILIEKIISDEKAWVHCKASKRPKLGQILWFENKIRAVVVEDQHHLLTLQFESSVYEILSKYGHMPLPPYLGRKDEEMDKERYQTVYAKDLGSVAAPTAGLHFDEQLLSKLNTAYITLHVGAGTFQSVRVKNLDDHIMHPEYAEISDDIVEKIKNTQSQGGRIIAVGTTTVRTLEQASLSGELKSYRGETKLFIKPGFKFNCVDAIITNFHLPESTLLMLVCAFGGYEKMMKAYEVAVREKYRFFSYGDAMFIARKNNAI